MENLFKRLITDKYKDAAFGYVYMAYKRSTGINKSAYAEVMASKLVKDTKFIIEDDIPGFLDSIELDSLWNLAVRCKNEHLKSIAKEKVISILLDDDLIKEMEEKSKNDDLILAKKMD